MGKAEECLVNQAPSGLLKCRAGGRVGRGGEGKTHKTVLFFCSGSAVSSKTLSPLVLDQWLWTWCWVGYLGIIQVMCRVPEDSGVHLGWSPRSCPLKSLWETLMLFKTHGWFSPKSSEQLFSWKYSSLPFFQKYIWWHLQPKQRARGFLLGIIFCE